MIKVGNIKFKKTEVVTQRNKNSEILYNQSYGSDPYTKFCNPDPRLTTCQQTKLLFLFFEMLKVLNP